MHTSYTDKQRDFEEKVAALKGFTRLSQRDEREQMILDDFYNNVSYLETLSGTIGYKKNNKGKMDILLIATKDSEVNHIESITPNMIDLLIAHYTIFKHGKEAINNFSNKVIFCTNIPIEIHSNKVKQLKEEYNLHIESIGYSFCLRHKLEYTQMY